MSTSNLELVALLEKVADADSFLEFVHALSADRAAAAAIERAGPRLLYGQDVNGWANVEIDSFLEAGAAWAQATDFGVSQGLRPGNIWARVASFLYLGKIYE